MRETPVPLVTFLKLILNHADNIMAELIAFLDVGNAYLNAKPREHVFSLQVVSLDH